MKWFNCTKCKVNKSELEFYTDSQKKRKKTSQCKSCMKNGVDRDNRKIYEKNYRLANLGARAAIVKKSMSKNADHHKAQRRKYLITEKGQATYRKQTQTRYARMKAVFIEHVDTLQIYVEQSGICYLCNNYFELKEMHADHVHPIAKGGMHERKNIKMACAFCNLSKGQKVLAEVSLALV